MKKQQKVTGLYVGLGETGVKVVDNHYKEFQKVIGADTFDIITRKFGDKYFDIYVDDEGLFKDVKVQTIVTKTDDGRVVEQVYGPIFIVKHDGEGNAISLSDDEIKMFQHEYIMAYFNQHTGIQPILWAGI